MANFIHPLMLNVKQYLICVGTKPFWCNTPDKQVNLKLKYKTRQISEQQSALCARYEIVFSNIDKFFDQQIWIFNFIISSTDNNIHQFLEEFAQQYLITDEVLTRAGLQQMCHFQNCLNQNELDLAQTELKTRFRQNMAERNIIIIEDNDTMISEWDTYLKTEFDIDTTQFCYNQPEDEVNLIFTIC